MTNKRISGLLGVAGAAMILLLMMTSAWSQENLGKKAVQGSWRVRVTSTPGPGALPPFEALHTYNTGGGFLESNNVSPPSQATVGQGSWSSAGHGRFDFTFIKFLFDPQGQFVGTAKVSERIQLSAGGNEYTGVGRVEIYDPSGRMLVTGETTTQATRIRAEPID
jgi:hypothetical protein